MSSNEESAREIEEHLKVLADYDVIPYDVAETLTEYVWKILTGSREEFGNVAELKDYWKRLEEAEDEDEDEDEKHS